MHACCYIAVGLGFVVVLFIVWKLVGLRDDWPFDEFG